jgi:hypothetical protein
MAYVVVSDIEDRFRPLSPDEVPQAQALLDDAWAIINAQIPLLASTIASQPTAPLGVLRAVLCNMVIRVLRNPNGVKQWAVDDYSETRDSSVSAGSLYLSTDEMALITQSLGNRRRGAFSITPAGDTDPRTEGAEYGFPYGYERGGYYGSTWPDQAEFPGRPW